MYTKEELRSLRDLLIRMKNETSFDFRDGWSTVSYIYEVLIDSCDPEKFESYITCMANQAKHITSGPEDVDYTLAYNIFFGDISSAPLHINDAFELIAVWRLKSPNSPMERYPCIHENS